METLFCYGTIADSKIQQKIIGRTVDLTKDTLKGFKLSNITLDDGMFLIVVRDNTSREVIEGYVLEITSQELVKFDAYETEAYKRSVVKLESGTKAWVYHQ